jgi:hemin uptake protein HemP
MTPPPPRPAVAPSSTAPDRRPRTTLRLTSEQLFAGAAEVQIEHAGSLYRLKRTSLGKLILTK